MKPLIFFLSLLVFSTTILQAQDKFSTKTGHIFFEANVPSFEPVEANHTNVSAIVKSDGTLAALALVNGFRFKIALMEEHFNENFAESSTYPKITFKGKIQAFDSNTLTEEKQAYTITGVFSMHGKEKEVTLPASIYKKDGSIFISSQFSLKPEDFDIKIPNVVSKKIAKEIDVTVNFQLK